MSSDSNVLAQLREIVAAMPTDKESAVRVVLLLGWYFNEQSQEVPLPAGQSIVTIWVDHLNYSFFVEDAEWERGKVAEEIIAHMQKYVGSAAQPFDSGPWQEIIAHIKSDTESVEAAHVD